MNAVASQKFRQVKSSLEQVWQRFGYPRVANTFQNTTTMVMSVGALLALGAAGTGIYAVTRPCTMGGCPVLEQAESLYDSTSPMLDVTASTESVSQTYTTLLALNYQLEAVPLWSPYYSQAQSMLAGNEKQADVLAQLLAAQQQAWDAAIASQTPPYPLKTWQTIAADWQGAIAQLEAIATEDHVAPLVQTKLAEYEANLAIVQQQIQREAAASAAVAGAREALHDVDAHISTAQSLDHWQAAEAMLQATLEQLAEVPANTMPSAEAEHLLAIYQPQLITVEEQLQSEEQSTQFYTSAKNAAEQAVASQQTSQWSAAVNHWQSAVSYIQQVPEGSLYHDQVKPLLVSYGSALDQAQQQLDQVITVEQAQASLNQSCVTLAKVCQLIGPGTDPNTSLQVRLTPSYDGVVAQVMQANGPDPAELESSELESSELASLELKSSTGQLLEGVESVNDLLGAIATVGKDHQIAVELYRSDGEWLGTYQPEISGYTQAQATTEQPTINILSVSTSN